MGSDGLVSIAYLFYDPVRPTELRVEGLSLERQKDEDFVARPEFPMSRPLVIPTLGAGLGLLQVFGCHLPTSQQSLPNIFYQI